MAYGAKILRYSIGPNGVRLITSELTYPRFVHAEFMTHRMLSKNSASSRAIPVAKLMERVKNDPVVPVWIGKNQSGMQAKEELDIQGKAMFLQEWLGHRDAALRVVEKLNDIKVHKQIANRLLEPWMWITVICTGTEYDNFFALRRHPDAQPEIKHLADIWHYAIEGSEPKTLKPGEWHLPLVDDYEQLLGEGLSIEDIVKVCVGRCARVSYLTHDGKRDPQADIDLANRLLASGHMSPFEHAAMCLTQHEVHWSGNIKGWLQARKRIPNEAVFQNV